MTIQEILEDLKVDHLDSGHHHCRPGWVQLKDCPFCGSDKYHLGINLSLRYSSCYKCGWHHLRQLLEKCGATRKQTKEFWKDIETVPEGPQKKRTGLVEPKRRGPLLPAHKQYLRGRGFEPKEIERIWKVEGIGLSARLAWRIYIPITLDTKRVSWTTRTISDKVSQRYISASVEEEAVNHRHVVYGLDYCHHSAIICEGPTDAWAIGPGGVSLFGIDFSVAQVRALVRIPYRFICFDSSSDAQARAEDLASQLSVFPGSTVNILIDAKDPGSAPEKEIQCLRRVARL